MERVLVIADIYPFPFTTGGKLRTANLIIQLSKKFKVDFACFSLDKVSLEQRELAQKYCDDVTVVEGKMPTSIEKVCNLLKKMPNAEFIVHSTEMEEIIGQMMKNKHYKAILVERLYSYQYTRHVHNRIPVLVDMHDIEHEAMAYFGKISKSYIQRLHYRIEEKKVRKLEKRVFNNAYRIVTVSERDMDAYIDDYPSIINKTLYINNGIDLTIPAGEPIVERDTQSVLFVGSLRHPPNLHGLRWFVENAWPAVAEQYPNAVFRIVGSGEIDSKDKLLFNNTKGVEFIGFVENLYPLLRKATCLVVPLFSGSGTRLKILEAFSFNLPVVSTSVGAEGLPYTNGENLLIANSEKEMLAQIAKIFDNKGFASYLAENGYRLVTNDYNWDVIGKKLINEIDKI